MSEYTINVPLEGRAYDIHIGADMLESLGELTAAAGLKGRCAIITDTNVAPLYSDIAKASLEASGYEVSLVVVPAGEASKSLSQAEMVCDQMINDNHDRSSFVVALGGGVIGDLAGFVAAIFYRGVPFVQVPTTVVAQVDSSVGGKTGVNATEGKNLIGAFHQPVTVIADTNTLSTLPAKDFNEGFAEILKHAAIRDASLFPLIRSAFSDPNQHPELVSRNVAIKAAVVAEDEKETSGVRALLNFGHTIGHGIESAAGYGKMLHGEAIAIGLRAATELSVQRSTLTRSEADHFIQDLAGCDLPLTLPDDIAPDLVLQRLARDKKFVSGQIRFVLLRSLGDAFVSNDVTQEDLKAAVQALQFPVAV